jgi:hypothetical protein
VDFEDDPTYKDMPHLFLQTDDRYAVLKHGAGHERHRHRRRAGSILRSPAADRRL